MPFEVEQKFRLFDTNEFLKRTKLLDIEFLPAIVQIDSYFAHPSRDFGVTDEALRIRRVGESNIVTYKGPKIDATTKSRREIELPIADGDASYDTGRELFFALGFERFIEVRKSRRRAGLSYGEFQVEIAWDSVERLGQFIEVETVVEESRIDDAREAVASLAQELSLNQSIRESYAELLLQVE